MTALGTVTACNSLTHVVPSCVDTCPVKALLKYLEKVYGAVGDYLPDDNGFPKCMFFQDSFMKDLFNFYPDRICIDCSFKKFEIGLFMILFICEDSNGINFIVAVGFLQHNDVESLSWLLAAFRKHNPNWRKIRSLAVDPRIQHWELVKEMFPFSCIIICSYHAIKEFKSSVNNFDEFKNVPDEQKNYAIKMFKNLIYAMTNSEFDLQLQKYNTIPQIFVSYLFKFWFPLKDLWWIPLDFANEDVFKSRNDYLEKLNNAVQMIFESEKNYVEFIKKIFLMILFKKREKPNESVKPVSILYSRFSAEYQICKTLTPYAAEFVIKQLDLSREMTTEFNPLSEYYKFNYLDMEVQASAATCQCNFYVYTLMPCRHMFCVRKTNYFLLFDGSSIDLTWNKQYHQQASTCMEDYLTNSIDNHIPQDIASRTTLASHLFEITTPILLDSPRDVYESRINILKNLVQAWKVEDEISVKFIGINKSLKKDSSHISKYLNSSKESDTVPSSQKVHNFVKIHTSGEEKLSEINLSSSQEINVLKQSQCSEMDIDSSNTNQESLVVPHEQKRASRQRPSDVNHCLLNGKHINLAYIVTIICLTKESCVNWLKAHGFLPTSMKCPICNEEMMSKSLSRLNDGVTWRCMDKTCIGKRASVRVGTWFEESNLTLQQMLIFTYMWLNKFSKARIVLEMSISAVNYVKWDKFHRRVCESLNEDSSIIDQAGPSSYNDALHKWLQNHAGKDTFLEFLKDAAYVYGKDKEKHSFGPKPQINQMEINQSVHE